MTITEFITKAIEGGWRPPNTAHVYGADAMDGVWVTDDRDTVFQLEDIYLVHEVLLDPKFWQALGKTKGWAVNTNRIQDWDHEWLYRWHCMIDALADERTIEEYLATL